MPQPPLSFGDAFCCKSKDYIFLGKLEGVTYAGRLYSITETDTVLAMEMRLRVGPGTDDDHRRKIPLYTYVMLKEIYNGRMANLKKLDYPSDYFSDYVTLPQIHPDDIKQIHNELMNHEQVTGKLRRLL